jgi:hypothetical protein
MNCELTNERTKGMSDILLQICVKALNMLTEAWGTDIKNSSICKSSAPKKNRDRVEREDVFILLKK